MNSSRLLRTREPSTVNHSRPPLEGRSPGSRGEGPCGPPRRLRPSPRDRESGNDLQALLPGYSGGTAPDFDRLPCSSERVLRPPEYDFRESAVKGTPRTRAFGRESERGTPAPRGPARLRRRVPRPSAWYARSKRTRTPPPTRATPVRVERGTPAPRGPARPRRRVPRPSPNRPPPRARPSAPPGGLDTDRSEALPSKHKTSSGAREGHNREAGESPARSRHCEWRTALEEATRRAPGKARAAREGVPLDSTSQETYPSGEDAMPRGCRPAGAEIARRDPHQRRIRARAAAPGHEVSW
jgi:hypothetical protein